MSKNVLIGIGVVGILVIVGAAAYILRPTAEASAPIEAVPLKVDESKTEGSESDVGESASAEEQMGMPVPGEDPVEEMVVVEETKEAEKSESEMPVAEEPAEKVEASASQELIVFTIMQAESEVRFTLDELLSGVPTTVIGTTDQVAGEIAIDPAAPANSKVGVIRVNARTFVTDNNFRNRAINNEILETDEFEFVNFTPNTIQGFPENPEIGEVLNFQITGDLTIRDITNEVTFDVTVTAVSENKLQGSASTMVAREDYDLRIPSVPRVADVDEEVLLEIDFVAVTK